MSDSADCYAVIAVRPDGLIPRGKPVANLESGHRFAYSAETVNDSLVIDELELTNSMPNRLGRLSGHCANATVAFPVACDVVDERLGGLLRSLPQSDWLPAPSQTSCYRLR
jgi:hypothetical protein